MARSKRAPVWPVVALAGLAGLAFVWPVIAKGLARLPRPEQLSEPVLFGFMVAVGSAILIWKVAIIAKGRDQGVLGSGQKGRVLRDQILKGLNGAGTGNHHD